MTELHQGVEQLECDMLLVVDMVHLFVIELESAILFVIFLFLVLMVCVFSRFRVF